MTRAHLKTRTASSSSVSATSVASSALTHAELDSNLINLRDSSWGLGDDSSTVLQVSDDKTITIAGGTNITTALSGDTLTITGAAAPITALNNKTANRLTTIGSTTTELDGEANATFDGSTLAITGAITASTDITATGNISNDAVQIADHTIKTIRSNDDLEIESNGTGQVQIKAAGGDFSNYSTSNRYDNANMLYHEDNSLTIGAGNRSYKNGMVSKYQLTAGQSSSNSNDRFRHVSFLDIDLNGSTSSATSSYISRGPMALSTEVHAKNSNSSDAVLGNASAVQGGLFLSTSSTGDITISGNNSGIANFLTYTDFEANSGSTISVDNAYSYLSKGFIGFGDGTTTLTNQYHFYAANSQTNPTNEYAFYTDDPTMESAIGTLEQYRETINALTNSPTITVDCALAPVHTITIAQAGTQFNFKNLGTGQTCTVVVKQDGTGNRTATFTEEDSTAIKFQGGAPTLSTGANAIDVITVFNTGSEVLGNCAKAYA